jgi:hypothetical protein
VLKSPYAWEHTNLIIIIIIVIRAVSLNDVSSDEAQKQLFYGSFSIVFGSLET